MLLTRLTSMLVLLFLALSLQSVSAMDHAGCQKAVSMSDGHVMHAAMAHDDAGCDACCTADALQGCQSCSHCIHAPSLPTAGLQIPQALAIPFLGELLFPLADLPPAALFKPPRDLV